MHFTLHTQNYIKLIVLQFTVNKKFQNDTRQSYYTLHNQIMLSLVKYIYNLTQGAYYDFSDALFIWARTLGDNCSIGCTDASIFTRSLTPDIALSI